MATLSSVDADTPTGRRLRAGKEIDSSPESARKPGKPKGNKRPRSVSNEDEQDSQPTAKRPKGDDKTPVKSQSHRNWKEGRWGVGSLVRFF